MYPSRIYFLQNKSINPFAKTSQGSKPPPYISFAHGTYSNDSIMGANDFYHQHNIFGMGHPLTNSQSWFMNPFGNSGCNSPKHSEIGFPNDRLKPPYKSEARKGKAEWLIYRIPIWHEWIP